MNARQQNKPQSPISSLHVRLLIFVAFIALGFPYSFATPILEKNDEESHAWFTNHLAQGGGLPVQTPGLPESPLQREGSQPPLYYAAAALVWHAFDTSDFEAQLRPNASPTFDPYNPSNKNLLIITPEKRAFDYHNSTLAVFVLRLLGILPGCVTVWLTYSIAHALTRDKRTALLAMALTAFNPMFLTVMTALGNDGLVIMFSTIALYLMLQLVLEGITLKWLVITGVVLALASLSKVSGTLLLPIAAVAVIGRELLAPPIPNQTPLRRAGRVMWQGSLLFVLWLLLAGWWYARNLVLYGDFTGTSVMAQMMTPRDFTLSQALSEFNGFKMSYIAMFGQFAVPADDIVYQAFDALVIVAVTGLVVGAIRFVIGRRSPSLTPTPSPSGRGGRPLTRASIISETKRETRWLAGGMLGLHIILLLVSIVRWTMMTPASHGRLLFPAIASTSTFLALGLMQLASLVQDKHPRAATVTAGSIALVVALALGAVAAIAPFRYILPAYMPPLLTQLPENATPASQRYRSLAELVGYDMQPATVRPGDKVRVTAFLRALSTPPVNYMLVVKLYGRDNVELARFDTFTGGGLWLSSEWRPGDLIKDEVQLTVPGNAATPAILKAQFELYNRGAGDLVQSKDAKGQAYTPLYAGSTLLPLRSDERLTASQTDTVVSSRLAQFGDIAALSQFIHTPAIAGHPLTVTLQWQTLRQAGADYTVFVHLLSEDNSLKAQHDGPPDQGNYPTSRWAAATMFSDTHTLNLPADLAPGRYRLTAGLYDPANGERLVAVDAQGHELPNHALVLTELVIE